MNLTLISTALSVALSLTLGSMLSFSETLWLQIIAVVISLTFIRWFPLHNRLTLALLALCSLSFWYSYGWVEKQLDHRLPLELSGQSFYMSGCITDQPKQEGQYRTALGRVFRFELSLDENTVSPNGLRRVRLSWYEPVNTSLIRQGTCIQGELKLRTPRNFENGLTYDYQASMLYQGVDAIGYVRSAEITHQAEVGWIDRLKTVTLEGQSMATAPWVKGLVFGDKAAFTPEQWALVQRTGTLHLLVVSGLHVSLIAFAGLLTGSLLSRLVRVIIYRQLSNQQHFLIALKWLPLACAIACATIYVVIAGAGLSLIRAWVMLLFIAFVWYYPKRLTASLSVLGAMVAVLLVNPISWTQSGFWFSFAAVGALVFFFSGRRTSKLSALLLPQLVIVVALVPVTTQFDQVTSPVHILANTLAIPLITFGILPLTFLSLGVSADIGVSMWAVDGLTWISSLYWQVLANADELPIVSLPHLSNTVLLCWLIMICLIFLGVRVSIALLTGLIIYLVAITQGATITPTISLIDSGQGQSLVVTDERHTLVIDTGPALSPEFSIASMVLVPTLRNLGARYIDQLVLSHSDNDHAGGVADLRKAFDISTIWVGQPIAGLATSARSKILSCHGLLEEGHIAREVEISALIRLQIFPIPDHVRTDDNNSSCVIKLHWYGHTLMIPGDASIDVERHLVSHYQDQLNSDILIAGHHGSKTSTARFWLNAVQPKEVWISSGFGNRFGHPHSEVVERINDSSAILRNTATAGKITMTPEGNLALARNGWQPKWRSE